MIKVIVTHGENSDTADAEDPESACVAAREMMKDARDHGAGDPRAAFIVGGKCVRSNVKRSEV